MNRIGIVGLAVALIGGGVLLFTMTREAPTEPSSSKEPTSRSQPEVAPPPEPTFDEPPLDATAFHALDHASRKQKIEALVSELEPDEAYREVSALLAKFDPETEFNDLTPLLELLLARMAEDPTSFALPHDDLADPKSEVARLISARLLLEAFEEEWYFEPMAEEFLTACESSKSPMVRMTLIEYSGELLEFEPAEVLIESVLLDSSSPQDIESGTLALESIVFEQKRIRSALAAGQPLHPAIEGKYATAEDVPDITPFAKKLLVEVALNGKQTNDTLLPILDLLIHLRARSEIDYVLKRFRQADLVEMVEKAQMQEIRR